MWPYGSGSKPGAGALNQGRLTSQVVYSVLPVAASESRLVHRAFCLVSSTHMISHVNPELSLCAVHREGPCLQASRGDTRKDASKANSNVMCHENLSSVNCTVR